MAIEDFKDCSVHVFFLFLPYVAFALPFLISTYIGILSLFMASVLFLVATTLHKLNMLTSGDVIVAPLIFSMPFALTYIIIAFLVIANVHIACTYSMRGDINKLPLVGYIGVAEFVGALCFLLIK